MILLGDDSRRGGLAAADRLLVCWSLGFNRASYSLNTKLTKCQRVIYFKLREVRLGRDLS